MKEQQESIEGKVIYKYTIPCNTVPGHAFKMIFPVESEIIKFDTQDSNGNYHVWALQNKNAEYKRKNFMIAGTGMDIPKFISKNNHCGTVQVDVYVWHLFDLGFEE